MNEKKGASYCYRVENYKGSVMDYLQKKHDYSSRIVKSVKREGELLLNGKNVNFTKECQPGDEIQIILKSEHFDAEPENLPLRVLYEDKHLLVVDKPPFMVTHPTKSHQSGTLSNAIYGYYEQKGYEGKIHFISRLDMDTSGVVLIAKNKYMHHLMQNVAEYKPFDKYYYAIVRGDLPSAEGVIDLPIVRSGEGIKREVDEEGRECVTQYKVADKKNGYSLVRLRLITGRTHQIRVHLKSIGCPIISDNLYGEPNSLIDRQALHAYEVSFVHPITNEKMHIIAPLPEDFKNALEELKMKEEEGQSW